MHVCIREQTSHTLKVSPWDSVDLQTTEELSGWFQSDLCCLESKPSTGVGLCDGAVHPSSLQYCVSADDNEESKQSVSSLKRTDSGAPQPKGHSSCSETFIHEALNSTSDTYL